MIRTDPNDTIAAIATPLGESGIGIVRLSGRDALKIADKIFSARDGKKPSSFKTYTLHYGWVVNSLSRCFVVSGKDRDEKTRKRENEKTDVVDEVLLTVMRAPGSYTKEDIVEINCHGGIVALRAVLDLVLACGCRLAEPGEFTKRAFLNGRIDLAQAEAVLDIIRAKTDSALRISQAQLSGALSGALNKIGNTLLKALSVLEANIDFPEEETSALDLRTLAGELTRANAQLVSLLESARRGRVLREGLSVVICGKPNVGKSSLLNALLKQERSIVTPVAGTTRDTIEEIIDLKGIPIRIVDTAGIIEPRDLVEKKAVLRSKKYVAMADIVILLFDGSRKLTQGDEVLIRKLKNKNIIAVINKIDLKPKVEKARLLKKFRCLVEVSAKKMRNIDRLEQAVADLVYQGKVPAPESLALSNLRHIEALRRVQKLVAEAANSVDNKVPIEFIAQDIKDALCALDEILGRKFSEGLLDKIFSEFCIGK